MTHDIRCIIIDDEPKSIDVLEQRMKLLFPEILIAGSYTDWKNGIEVLRSTKVDLLFLDVSMPEKSGIDILKLFSSIPFQVIFITAHSQFAIDAIKFSAAGYVLKPIDDYELTFAVHKALQKIKESSSPAVTSGPRYNSNKVKIGIPNANGIDYMIADEILYFESVNKYTKVVTKDHSILSSYNLGEFKKILDENIFFQVHRSYLINLNYIKRYESSGILIMDDGMQIPVAKSVKVEFMNVFSTITRTASPKPKENQ